MQVNKFAIWLIWGVFLYTYIETNLGETVRAKACSARYVVCFFQQ